jgi:hypothetical protein
LSCILFIIYGEPMKSTLAFIMFLTSFCFFSVFAEAQTTHVKVNALEVDGKPVKASFKVRIVVGDKVLDAKTDESGFFLPAAAVGKDVGVLFEFKKYLLTFFFVKAVYFDSDWVVGVDTKPFDPQYLGSSDPDDTASISYLRLANPDGSLRDEKIVTVAGKPKVTITKIPF